MASPAHAYSAYKSAEVTTLTQRDLVVKLFEGVDRFLLQGAAAMRNGNREMAQRACSKAKRILVELLSTLNFEAGGEMAKQLRDLYLFMLTEISTGNMETDPERLNGVRRVVQPLLDGWRQIPDTYANLSSLGAGEAQGTFDVRT